jgi:hypothetical protein
MSWSMIDQPWAMSYPAAGLNGQVVAEDADENLLSRMHTVRIDVNPVSIWLDFYVPPKL